jgi:hypothetical protein
MMNTNRTFGMIASMTAALMCLPIDASANEVYWPGTEGGASVTLADRMSPVPEGSLVALGFFPGLNDSQIAALGGSPTMIWAAFSAWDTTTFDSEGLYWGQKTVLGGGGFGWQQAYLVAFNAPSVASATQWGVFRGPTVGDSWGDAWIIPPPGYNDVTLALESVGSGGVIVGTFGHLTYAPGWAQDTYTPGTEYIDAYALIPEPSTYMLVGTGLLGILGMMRRRRS